MEVIKVLPEHETQGEYVLINERDFDKEKHVIYEPLSNKEPAKKGDK